MNTTRHVSERTRKLSDIIYYLESDPIYAYTKLVSDTFQQGLKDAEIETDIAKGLIVTHPVPGRFCIFPEIYKEGNSGKPIISGNGCLTELISFLVGGHRSCWTSPVKCTG
ncbi:hypothetical protein PoB_004394900 [Plakobranchus ocellatus]|uniref:Uncharacterized protein n=1 Tax=Plakobranchus ocellatus TaxID=259542 RepID=A0AAV4BGH6_9GAST|nr:hypothetical protein PoB_004394900 [Plakobranchus ocellatus]